MKNDLILATSTADIQTSFSFKNADLNKFSESIAKIAIDSVSRNIELSKIFGRILDTECYKEDGFSSVADFAEKTFGIKRASAYQLANVGRRFFNSDTETAGKVVKLLGGKTGNLAELVNMTDEQIEEAIASERMTAKSTQDDLREIARSVKPAKVITEKKAVLSAVISHMTENGKIEVIQSGSVIVDNIEILKAIGFNERRKHGRGDIIRQICATRTIGAEFLAYSLDGVYVARITCTYIEKPKAPKAPKAPKDYDMTPEEYEAFKAWLAEKKSK